MNFLKSMNESELKMFGAELLQWVNGEPRLGLRMQPEIPDQIFSSVKGLNTEAEILEALRKLRI